MLFYLLLIGRTSWKGGSCHGIEALKNEQGEISTLKFLMQKQRQYFLLSTGNSLKKKSALLKPPVNGKTIIIKREAELMDPIKANTKSPEALQHKQSKVNSVIPQVSLTSTQFKETSI